jgi:UDP-2-acetamido-2,6-beta-L-arabino-hexul-4-ose reductase
MHNINKAKNALMKVLVTGAKGFIGKNLIIALKRRANIEVVEYDLDSPADLLEKGLAWADVIYHLAGVNRPEREEEFDEVNAELTRKICNSLRSLQRSPVFILSSSTQAALDNPYGLSKRKAEQAVLEFGKLMDSSIFVYRLPGVFGKWCKPNYNSVVATFCHHIAQDMPVSISDPKKDIELVYIDDVVQSFIGILDGHTPIRAGEYCVVEPIWKINLGQMADIVHGFRKSRETNILPDMNDRFLRCLYATYISYLPEDGYGYKLSQMIDDRGELAEILKHPHIGQLFVSRTRPGITRGNHYHDTKVEKFIVIKGDAIIRFRHILENDIIEYPVSGHEFRVVDIPPGYAHSIENVGETDLFVLFWANEVFDPQQPDAIYESVKGVI